MTNGAYSQIGLKGPHQEFLIHDAKIGHFDPIHVCMEDFAIQSTKTGNQNANFGGTASFAFSSGGDAISGGYLEAILPEITALDTVFDTGVPQTSYHVAWCHSIGIYLYKYIDFVVNGKSFSKLTPQYIDMISRMDVTASQRKGYNDMIGEMNIHTKFANHSEIIANQYDEILYQVQNDALYYF